MAQSFPLPQTFDLFSVTGISLKIITLIGQMHGDLSSSCIEHLSMRDQLVRELHLNADQQTGSELLASLQLSIHPLGGFGQSTQ